MIAFATPMPIECKQNTRTTCRAMCPIPIEEINLIPNPSHLNKIKFLSISFQFAMMNMKSNNYYIQVNIYLHLFAGSIYCGFLTTIFYYLTTYTIYVLYLIYNIVESAVNFLLLLFKLFFIAFRISFFITSRMILRCIN